MTDLTWADGLYLAFLTVLVCVPTLFLFGLVGRWTTSGGGQDVSRPRRNHLLFRGERLIDHDLRDLRLPDAGEPAQSDWDRVRAWLEFRFPDLPLRLTDVDPDRVTSFESRGEPLVTRLDFEPSGRTLRVTLMDLAYPDPAITNERLRLCRALEDQAAALFHAPVATWLCDTAGRPVWQNAAGAAIDPDDKDQILNTSALAPRDEDTMITRLTLAKAGGPTRNSYEVQSTRTDQGLVVHATDITRIVQAERAQHDFMQTLSRTFASLTIGLTVFDRNKTLALFNPALIDLTGLPPEFLSARPGLISFFDALRDRQVMPEPRNYGNWRTHINAMVETARGGLYHEVWSLATGQTYRVTGRPHPDGDVAFLFEDISVEMSATRQHRAEIDLRQAVLDQLDQGIAVFSGEDRVTLCNSQFGVLLGAEPEHSLAGMNLRAVMAAARARFPDFSRWQDIEQKIAGHALSAPVVERLCPPGHAEIDLRVLPLGRGQTMLVLEEHALTHVADAALKTG